MGGDQKKLGQKEPISDKFYMATRNRKNLGRKSVLPRLKYQKNMAPKKSKVKKPKVKKRVTQPAKSILERTICSHPMLKRAQKEVRELKKKSVKKYKK